MTRQSFKHWVKKACYWGIGVSHRMILNPINRRHHADKTERKLEIGSGSARLEGFETLNIVSRRTVDYVYDAAKPLPFPSDTFDVIYASHILEHIPWFRTEEVLREWVRILAPEGRLEIWVPDGEVICQTILDHSRGRPNNLHLDGWRKRNPESDPYLWANGRLFYGATEDYPSWHKAVFTESSLKDLYRRLGLADVRRAAPNEYRSGSHGDEHVNLGVFGTKGRALEVKRGLAA